MTLVSQVLTDAYRESNMIALSKVPNTAQEAEALRLLNNTFFTIYGTDAGENFQDFPLGNFGRQQLEFIQPGYATFFNNPPINRRLIVTNLAAITVYLPPNPSDGSRMTVSDPYGRLATFPVTIQGNGRTIEGAPSLVVNTNGASTIWAYRAELGDWVRVTEKAADEEMPFPRDFDDMFTIILAMRLNPRYGRTIDDQSLATLKMGRQAFVNRYLQSEPLSRNTDIDWPFMSLQSFETQVGFSSTAGFNRGFIDTP